MMMKIAQKCNLRLLPLPGTFCPVNAAVYFFSLLISFCCSFKTSGGSCLM